jgi:pSer/pThr/pTyr-binding forkhead associated (FHA) protein
MNGTYLNGERVRQTHSVVPGDILQLGAITLRVEYSSDTDPGRLALPVKSVKPMNATQPMRTLPSENFTMQEVKETPKRWWEFWKSE